MTARVLALLSLWMMQAKAQETGTSLQHAFNAALIRTMVDGDWQRIVSKYNKSFSAAWMCSLDTTRYLFPEYSTLNDWDVLKTILDRGNVRVLGFDANWGSDGNYKVNPPIGFWPELMDAAISKMNDHYEGSGRPVAIERVLLSTTAEILASLENKADIPAERQGDMTEPYFFVSSFFQDTDSGQHMYRHEKFLASCTVGANEHMGFTKRGSGITSLDMLNAYADDQTGTTRVGVLTRGNHQQYKPMLSQKIQGSYASEISYTSSDYSLLDSNLDDNLEVHTAFELAGANIQPGWTLVSATVDGTTTDLSSKSTLNEYQSAMLTFDHYVDTEHLVQAVAGDHVMAGIVAAMKSLETDDRIDVFAVNLMSPQAALFRRETPSDICPRQGFTAQQSSTTPSTHPSTGSLRRAFNAALIRIMDNGDWQRIVTKYNKPFSASWMCSLDTARYTFPEYATLSDSDVLKQVLDRGTLKVLGFDSDWGSDGNYKEDPPVGFWPEIMQVAVEQMDNFYSENPGRRVSVERVLLSSTADILTALESGLDAPSERQGDMTEPYFWVSSFFDSGGQTYFRHEYFDSSCTLGSAEHMGITRRGSNLTSQDSLNNYANSRTAATRVGVLTKGNAQQYTPVMSSRITYDYETEIEIESSGERDTVIENLDDSLQVEADFTMKGVNVLQGWTLSTATVNGETSELADKSAARLVSSGIFTFKHYAETAHLATAVARGQVEAGMLSAMRSLEEDTRLSVFSITLTSPQAALFRQDKADDVCPRSGFYKPETSTTTPEVVSDAAGPTTTTTATDAPQEASGCFSQKLQILAVVASALVTWIS